MPAAADLAALSRDAAIQAVGQSDAPIGGSDELIAAVTGEGLRSVVRARVAQIVNHGHSAENDDLLPIGWLPMEARHCFERVRGALSANPRDLNEVRRLIAEGTAFGLSALDRLDRGMHRGEG